MIKKISEKKTVVFQYTLWRKIYAIFLFVAVTLPILVGCASENKLFAGILVALFIMLLFDCYFKIVFGKILIKEDRLIVEHGGVFWKWFKKKEAFPWRIYTFKAYYFYYKGENQYSSIHVTDLEEKQCLILKGQAIKSFSHLIKLLKKYNPKTKLLSLEEHIRKKGFRGLFSK
ncbi:MAG: hypothetical protein QNJ26_01540 [Desulfobacterales bacterium]|nr:hypothetical protein [Desulfobacterales bacterium]